MNHRYDFVYLFDCKDGNPNGDPDAANSPRIDPQDMHGLVSDVCLKRKVRNFALLAKEAAPGYGIFVQQGSVLNERIAEAHKTLGHDVDPKSDKKKATREQVGSARAEMCKRFFDVRTFGAVMSTGAIILGLVPGAHRSTCSEPELVAPWVAGINPAMTDGG